MGKKLAIVVAVLSLPLLGLGLLSALVLYLVLGTGSNSSAAVSPECGESAAAPREAALDLGDVSGYGSEQLANAAEVMRAGAALEISRYGQTIGVMTAMGESGLRTLDHGDAVGPDSRGLFQQRDNGAWGSYADRMDPFTSATSFFEALLDVPDWEALEPTIAAHRVQRNEDAYHYTDYWEPAVSVVAALSDDDTSDTASRLARPAPCAPVYSGEAGESGWSHPVPGFTTFWNNFGNQRTGYAHQGEDFAAPADHPILAAADGTVSHVSCESWEGRSPCNVLIDHGNDEQGHTVQTLYVHMYPEQVFVQEGQDVLAGEEIAGVGTNGNSTGNHLHFEVWVDGTPVDPQQFMTSVGIDIADPAATALLNTPACGALLTCENTTLGNQ